MVNVGPMQKLLLTFALFNMSFRVFLLTVPQASMSLSRLCVIPNRCSWLCQGIDRIVSATRIRPKPRLVAADTMLANRTRRQPSEGAVAHMHNSCDRDINQYDTASIRSLRSLPTSVLAVFEDVKLRWSARSATQSTVGARKFTELVILDSPHSGRNRIPATCPS